MGQDQDIRNSTRFTGTSLESKLNESERIARNHQMLWFIIILVVVGCGVGILIVSQRLGELEYWLWAIVPVTLLVAILRYDRFCHERKSIQKLTMSYLQREAGGTLGETAEVGLSQFYESTHDPPGDKINMLERIIKILKGKCKK